MSHQFEIRREVVLPATPEQVFAAVTTGTAAWLFPTDADPGASPAGFSSTEESDPPNRFVTRQEGPDGWFNALEFLIEARDGGTAVLRYVHSGVMTDDWEGQYDGAAKHTDFYMHTLGQYLRYFDGRPVTYVTAEGPEASMSPDGFEVLLAAVGAGESAAVGDRVRVDVPGAEPLEAEIDYLTPHFLGLRSGDALYRFFGRNAFGAPVGLSHHLFAPGVDAAKAGQAWSAWLDGLYV